jgi:hypothetical protein
VSSDSHGNEAVVASYNRAKDVQSKRDVADGDRPLDHDADQGTWRQLVCGCHQHAVAADIHRRARTLYLLWPLDGVTSNKLERKASLPAALSFIPRSHVLAPLAFLLSSWAASGDAAASIHELFQVASIMRVQSPRQQAIPTSKRVCPPVRRLWPPGVWPQGCRRRSRHNDDPSEILSQRAWLEM